MIKKNFYTPLLLVLLVYLPVTLFAQRKGIYSNQVTTNPGSMVSINLPSITTLDKFVKKADAIVRVDFGNDYLFGKTGMGTNFQLTVGYRLTGFSGAVQVFTKEYTAALDNTHPEAALKRDLKETIIPVNGSMTPTGLTIDRLELSSITVTDAQSGGSYAPALTAVRLTLSYTLDYAIDVRMKGIEISQNPPMQSGSKAVSFSWNTPYEYPNYQFQLLRLYNIDPAKIIDENYIQAKIDWTKAATFETETDAKQLELTMAEGTGFYAWRVRPVGTYFENGIGHYGNWGDWDDLAPANGTILTLPLTGNNKFFFFQDPDDARNYIYSRIFSEENKIKETISYANTLQQKKQSQVYIPSDNTTVTSQTIQDYVGREALQTLPVPVDGKLAGYKEGFAKSGTELYAEKHFDENTNLKNPSTIGTGSLAGSYYTGTNNIPSAKGYPYSRILFYNDGTGRVKEQSGVGKEQMVGDQSAGMGHTVRTLYGTPAEDELVALFGDEAPNHESIQKIITIDQNNIASITYKGKDGKVIATAMTFVDNESQSLLPLNENTNPIPVKDRMVGGVKTDDAYVSAKRVSFTDPVSLAPEYLIECKEFELLCADVELDCGYEVRVIIHNLDDPSQAPIVRTAPIKNLPCEDIASCGKTGKYRVVRAANWTGGSMPIALPPGNYMIEKKLVASRDISVTLTNQEKKINEQLGPLKGWIIGSLQAVACPEQLRIFYNNLVALGNKFNNNELGALCTNPAGSASLPLYEPGYSISFPQSFMEIYCNPAYKSLFSVEVYGTGGKITTLPVPDGVTINTVFISTPCCAGIKLDVQYQPPFKCPSAELFSATNLNDKRPTDQGGTTGADINHNFLTNPEWTEIFPDYEGYALSMLMSCNGRSLAEAEEILYGYMPGWTKGDFNKMTHHMLTDVYSCDGKGSNEPAPENTADPSPEPPDPCDPSSSTTVPGTQYKCSDLAQCWTNLVMLLVDSYCIDPGAAIEEMSAGGNIANETDENNNGNQGPHDSHFDDGLKDADLPGIVKWLAKKKMSKKLRDMQDPSGSSPDALPDDQKPKYTFHLVDMFLNCTGYKFADVLEPADGDCSTGNGVAGPFNIAADFDGDPDNGGEYNSCPYKTSNWKNIDVELDENFQPVANSRKIKDLFPNIQNPVYAFKYFEYKSGTFPNLELLTCYKDPNDCYVMKEVNGQQTRVTIPCCFKLNTDGETYSTDFCDVGQPGTYVRKNDDVDKNGSYDDAVDKKWIVKNFCGLGKVECPYEEPEWSCNQRYLFFQYLKSYREYPTPFEPDQDNRCSWMSEPRNWYRLPIEFSEVAPPQDYVSLQQFQEITGHDPSYYGSQYQDPVEVPGVNSGSYGSGPQKTNISYIEYEATQKRIRCEKKCLERIDEFRQAVIQMFLDRCYVFEGCKRTDEDNIVNMEDVDKIVNEILKRCHEQCPITTYTCETMECRQVDAKFDFLGPNSIFSDLQYGVGGHPDFPTDCPSGTTTMTPCCTNLNSSNITIDNVECNPTYQLSYYEITNHRQSMSWTLNLDIVSMCNNQGVYVDANNDGRRDDYPLYLYSVNNKGERILISQDPSMQSNPEVLCPVPPVGNTFVPLQDYMVKPPLILDPQVPGVKVNSPKIGLTVQGGQ